MTVLIGVYGASGFGRETLPVVRKIASANSEIVFIDDAKAADLINNHRCLSFEEFMDAPASQKGFCIAIGDGRTRQRLAEKCHAAGLREFNICADSALILDSVDIGEGYIISPFVTLTSNIKIGCHFHANLYSYVAHDCVIGDYVTFAPSVKCNGNVVVEDFAYIGTGAILRQGRPGAPLRIGAGAVVGMGAVVTRDVPPGATVVGNPARPLHKD